MNDIVRIIITLAVATAGGLLLNKFKIPAGAMIGAMVLVIILNITAEMAYVPYDLRVFIQMFAGMRIGSKITKKDVFDIKKLVVPAFILVLSMVVLNLGFGTLMHTVGGLDIATSLFACSPGGMSDMAIIADELGANPVYVVVLQLGRILFIYLIIPPVFRHRLKNDLAKKAAELLTGEDMDEAADIEKKRQALSSKEKALRFLATAACGIVMGFIFWKLGIKAGALLGSMAGVAVLNITTGYAYFPTKLNVPIRIVAGAYIGQQMDMQSLIMMKGLVVPLIIMWLGVLVFTFIIPSVIQRFSKLDKATCMLASVPGGLQEMCLLAEDLGADVPKVTLLQTARQISVLIIFPNMLSTITRMLL